MAAVAGLILGPAIVMGAVIGIIELFFVHADEAHMQWYAHAFHALPFTILFVFVSMNITFAFALIGQKITENAMVDLGIRGAIALIAIIKIQAAAAVAGRIGEKLIHTLIIGALIFAAPYIWQFLGPMVSPMLPAFLQ